MKSLLSALTVASIALLTGCGSDGADYCQKRNECLAGNDKDEAACVAGWEGDAQVAAEYGCVDQFDAYSSCRASKATCVTDPQNPAQKDFTTRDQGGGADLCNAERDNLNACIDGSSAID